MHLAALRLPPEHDVEVILVNNLSTDNTVQLARAAWASLESAVELKIVNEDHPGLSFARNKGIETAEYDFLVFCDDDNRLDADYLLAASSILHRHAEIGALGGLGIPDYESIPDYWRRDFYIYGSGPQSTTNGKAPYLHGAGVILRKEVLLRLEKAGFRFLLSDRKGDRLSSGGDYELCYAVALAGYTIWYQKELTFKHFIPSDRTTWKYCRKFIRESAPSIDVLDVYRYYLTHDKALQVDFYRGQVKVMIFHAYKIYSSWLIRLKFKRDLKIVFLENFHIQFHKERIRCIIRSVFKYRKWARRVALLKDRLNTVKER